MVVATLAAVVGGSIGWYFGAVVFLAILFVGFLTLNLVLLNDRLADVIRSSATVSPVKVAYRHITEALMQAEREVLIFTYFTYDKKSQQRLVDAERMRSPLRKRLFRAFDMCIQNPKIAYTRIYQIDADSTEEARKVISSLDSLYASEIQSIDRAGNSKNAKVLFVAPVTHLTFILVDNRNAFFDVEISSQAGETSMPSFSIYMKDADDELLQNLRDISDKAQCLK